MAHQFKVNTISLSGAKLMATGDILYINGQQIISNHHDGINLSGDLTSSGQNLYTYIISASGDLNTKLYQTGSVLFGLINSASAGVSSINGASGIINITGTGNVSIISGGIGLIYISGDTGAYSNFYPFSNPNDYSTSGSLQNTGQMLYNYIVNTSGNLDNRIYQTGTNLYNLINNFSGIPEVTGVSITGSNSITGLLSISAGNNITFSVNDNTIEISSNAIGGGGGGAAITGLSITGSLYSSGNNGMFNISGSGDINVSSVSNNIYIHNVVSPWSTLTWESTTTWNVVPNIYEEKKVLYMTGHTTLAINNLYNGWQGVLQTIQSGNAISGYILSLPAGSKVANSGLGKIYLTSGSGARDMTAFAYDGSYLFVSTARTFN